MVQIKRAWERPDFTKGKQDRYKNLGLLLLRVGIGASMLFGHGAAKLVNYSDRAATFADPLGVGSSFSLILTIFAEVFCSIAIGFGFLTRLAVIPLMITMLMAIFVIHGDDPWSKKELATLYLIPLVTLLFTGAGRYSVDWLLFGRKKEG